jgi:hypothetical protein
MDSGSYGALYPGIQSRSVDKDNVASEPGSRGPWDPSTPGVMVMVSGSHGPSYPETLSFIDVLSSRMMTYIFEGVTSRQFTDSLIRYQSDYYVVTHSL